MKDLKIALESIQNKRINTLFSKGLKTRKLKKAKEVVVPSLQNFKTDPTLFYSPKNMKPIKKIFKRKHYKHKLKDSNSTMNQFMTKINEKHMQEGVMRRNKLLIEHIIQERMKNKLKYEPFSPRKIIF
mmetsp:Transcript_23214/g.20587  ORF Transcript_23214/g.20587 Transcript_23214/m.20587 type:complete len:128 (+) Transcript_23214:303-686(+)